MRTSSGTLVALAALLIGAGAGFALDAPARPQGRQPAAAYASASDAMRVAVQELNAGDTAGAVKALEYAAKQGNPLAQWKLGKLHASGEGVPLDDLKAFEYFSKIADAHADENPDSPQARIVANAFVALGTYFLDGIKGTYVQPNAARAHEMFYYAAAYFRDPNAQYSLARLYLDGRGVPRDPRQAARWLNLAAEKGHAPAQAVLGYLLLNGQTGIPRQKVLGFMWLMIAREAAKDQWISELYEKGSEAVSESERQRAQLYVQQYHLKKR